MLVLLDRDWGGRIRPPRQKYSVTSVGVGFNQWGLNPPTPPTNRTLIITWLQLNCNDPTNHRYPIWHYCLLTVFTFLNRMLSDWLGRTSLKWLVLCQIYGQPELGKSWTIGEWDMTASILFLLQFLSLSCPCYPVASHFKPTPYMHDFFWMLS